MNKDLIRAACNTPFNKSHYLKEGVYLLHYENQNYVIKQKKKGFIGKLKQLNEYKFYKNINSIYKYFGTPKLIGICPDKSFILSHVKGEEFKKIPAKTLIPAYIEFQNTPKNVTSVFNHIFLIFRGFFYRVCLVSIFTLTRRTTIHIVFKILSLYCFLNFQQQKYNKLFRLHGDLYRSNLLKSQDEKIVFLDFENTFATRKWPMAELVGLCLHFDDEKLIFSNNYLHQYLQSIDFSSEITEKSLKRQIRFGILQHSVSQIAQTNGELKRNTYLKLLNTVLEKQKFETWYAANLKSLGYMRN